MFREFIADIIDDPRLFAESCFTALFAFGGYAIIHCLVACLG